MTATERCANALAALDPRAVDAELLDAIRMHVFDTIGAAFAGAGVADTPPVAGLVADVQRHGPALAAGQRLRTTLPLAALLGCVATRCTEVDDIHIASCVTPGSVVVPTALAVASTVSGVDDRRVLAACLAGYEATIRFGLAIDGPRALYKGIWPTYLAGGFGAAVTAGVVLGLTAAQLAQALAIAATLATGTTGGRVAGLTSRWFVLGCAVQSGVMAALAAARGMEGDVSLLEGRWSEITGTPFAAESLVEGIGTHFHAAAISFKPICAAKQTIAAVYGLRAILDEEHVAAAEIARIAVAVPNAYRAMIDQPDLPRNRLASIANVRYQLALAALDPDKLLDVVRGELDTGANVAAFAARVEVASDAELDALYPAAWPARVTVTTTGGTVLRREMLRPPGDPGTDYGWPALEAKFRRVAPHAAASAGALAAACKRLGEPDSVRSLLAAC